MRVYNRRRPAEIPHGAVYVGRPTKYGNPFSKGNKSQNIADFSEYAENRLEREPHWLDELKGKDLVCWCSPEGCHADVLMKLANTPTVDEPAEIDWDTWADANAPEDITLDSPSDWEVMNRLA